MYLYLLEVMYPVQARETVETWLSQADLGSVLIITEQYDDEILTVLASAQTLVEAQNKLQQHPAVSLSEEKRRAVYQVTTTTAPTLVLRSFPLSQDEEWYLGTGTTAYLCMQSHHFSDKQISWLATCTQIVGWEYEFDLVPMLVEC